MKPALLSDVVLRSYCLCLILTFLGTAVTEFRIFAQESLSNGAGTIPSTVSDNFGPSTPTTPSTDSNLPDAIQDLISSVVTVIRVESAASAGGDPNKTPLSHLGVVIDSQGYIAIPLLPDAGKLFKVRFSNQKEVEGDLILIDESIKVGILKVELTRPIKAVSLDNILSAKSDQRVFLVPSKAGKKPYSGRIINTAFDIGEGSSTKIIQSDVACPLSDFGSLMVSEDGEPIGLVLTLGANPKPFSIVVPLKEVQTLLQTAIDKPKDAPLVRLPKVAAEVDIHKPVSITFQPVPPLAKSLVELFTPRGAKIVEGEAGKRLKIEAPPIVLEEIANLLGLVASEVKKAPESSSPNAKSKFDLQPATPLIKSLVELFAKRGANVLEYDEGKRLQIEAPAKAMEDLGKILEVVGCESQRVNSKVEANDAATTPPLNQQDDRANPQVAPTVPEPVQPKPLSYVLPGAADSREVTKLFHLKSSDVATTFEVVETLFQGKVRRIAADRRTNTLIVVALPIICDEIEAILLNLDTSPSRQQQRVAETGHQALPDTPAAKQLVERLAAQESAAASAATEIRRLQANGDAVEIIAPHQAQLKSHLQTAFDLKLQIEELQVKELQSRLSRLERQIGQRKELRDKIIARRAAELISGDMLHWNSPATEAQSSSGSVKGGRVADPIPPLDSKTSNNSPPGIEAIAARLDVSAAAIKNLSVTTDYKKRHVYGLPFDAPIELTLVTRTVIDGEGRMRVETTGQQINIEPDGKSARAYNGRWMTVFQNGEARSLTWYESNPPSASIDDFPSMHGIHPREFTTHFQSKAVSNILRTSAAVVAERTIWDDRPVTVAQTTPVQNASDSRRYRFWIDTERDVVVRRAIAIRYAEGQPWQEYARIETHDYQEIAPGIWLPRKVKYESLEVTRELSPEKLSWSYEGTNRDWKVNSELPADTFELIFPEGTIVNDHRSPVSDDRAAAADMKSLQEREMDSLQGTWCFDVLQSDAWPKPNGVPTDSSGRKSEQRWTIDGDRISWTNNLDGQQTEVSFTLDPTRTPKQIDFTFLSGPHKGKKSIGIYEPQKGNADYLWLCMTNPGSDAPRPTEVGYSSEKQQSMIGIYPIDKPKSLERFQGEWKMTLCDSTLKSLGASQEVVQKWSWVIRGDEILWSRDDDKWKLKLDVDASKSPGELDLTYLTGPYKGSKCLGMFQWGGVDKAQLMIAIQDPNSDAPRPTQFSMNSSIRTGLMILEPRSSNR